MRAPEDRQSEVAAPTQGDVVYKGEPGRALPRGVCDLPTERVPTHEPQFS